MFKVFFILIFISNISCFIEALAIENVLVRVPIDNLISMAIALWLTIIEFLIINKFVLSLRENVETEVNIALIDLMVNDIKPYFAFSLDHVGLENFPDLYKLQDGTKVLLTNTASLAPYYRRNISTIEKSRNVEKERVNALLIVSATNALNKLGIKSSDKMLVGKNSILNCELLENKYLADVLMGKWYAQSWKTIVPIAYDLKFMPNKYLIGYLLNNTLILASVGVLFESQWPDNIVSKHLISIFCIVFFLPFTHLLSYISALLVIPLALLYLCVAIVAVLSSFASIFLYFAIYFGGILAVFILMCICSKSDDND